jgi:hypothetical protein
LVHHELYRHEYESVIVGFLAMLRIDQTEEKFKEHQSYQPDLSTIIKVAQLLVIQRSLAAVEDGRWTIWT